MMRLWRWPDLAYQHAAAVARWLEGHGVDPSDVVRLVVLDRYTVRVVRRGCLPAVIVSSHDAPVPGPHGGPLS